MREVKALVDSWTITGMVISMGAVQRNTRWTLKNRLAILSAEKNTIAITMNTIIPFMAKDIMKLMFVPGSSSLKKTIVERTAFQGTNIAIP